ncbi:undecaprenyl-phosphate glucose phosphotransferase [Pectobacterium cacticida]|uniref:undecaprenyl-phosphate glucose phosphotransferase n=1 Tax=Pectobacterium cacticida TaxID=69221 RepID=UPI003986BEA4
MDKKNRRVVYTNSSIISMLQRISDISIILVTAYIVDFFYDEKISHRQFLIAFVIISIFQLICGISDFYRSWRGMKFSIEIKLLLQNWLLCIILGFYSLSFFSGMNIRINYYVFWFIIASLGFLISRASIRFLIGILRQVGYNKTKIVIVGSSKAGIYFINSILKTPWLGFDVIGYYVPDDKKSKSYDELGINKKGNLEKLILDAKHGGIDRVYIALSVEDSTLINYILSTLTDTTCTAFLIPDVFTYNILQSRSEVINGVPIISLYDSPMSGLNMIIKRTEDIIFSSIILIMISPLLVVISLMVKFTSPGPILFKQKRYGMDGKEISVWKFRSMTVMENSETVIQARRCDPRVTPVGAILRRTSLDELPQFFNVLRGDMSIVGPRPHAVVHNEQYRKLIKGYMLRHKVKPGITGWAQINGWRGETDTLEKMEKRVEYDLYYIQNWSVVLDIKIIFLTIFKGFVNKSAY